MLKFAGSVFHESIVSLLVVGAFCSADVYAEPLCSPAQLDSINTAINAHSEFARSDDRLQNAGLRVNKSGPYIKHVSGQKLQYTAVYDESLGSVRFQPSIQRLMGAAGLPGLDRQIFPPDVSEQLEWSQALDLARVPYDSDIIVPGAHGAATVNSNAKAMLMLGEILIADSKNKDGVLRKVLNLDAFRLNYAYEAINHPGAKNGPSAENFTSTDELIQWFVQYLQGLKARGKKIIPIARSASTGYYLEVHRRHPGLLDGLILMSPMHPEIGIEEGIDALYTDHAGDLESIDEPSLNLVRRVYGGMDWSNIQNEVSDLPILVLVGGKDHQVPKDVAAFYEQLVANNNRVNGEGHSQYMFLKKAEHDVLSFSNPDLSLPAYQAVQEFMYRIRYPEIYPQVVAIREQAFADYRELQKGPRKAKERLDAAQARVTTLNGMLKNLRRQLKTIASEFYFDYQVNYLSEREVDVSGIQETLAGRQYRNLEQNERNRLEDLLRAIPYTESDEFRSGIKKKNELSDYENDPGYLEILALIEVKEGELTRLNKEVIPELKAEMALATWRLDEIRTPILYYRAELRDFAAGRRDTLPEYNGMQYLIDARVEYELAQARAAEEKKRRREEGRARAAAIQAKREAGESGGAQASE